jgi:hypothetical protein
MNENITLHALICSNHRLADMACCILYCQRDINIGGLKTPYREGGSDVWGCPENYRGIHHPNGGLDKFLP